MFEESNNYIIENELGSGNFSTVYKALYKPENKIVAIKDITIIKNTEIYSDALIDNKIEILMNEVNILKILSDVCQEYFLCYFNHFIKDNQFIIINNYLEGYKTLSELSSHIRDYLRNNNKNIIIMLLNISNALQILHSKEIAHRDLNRGNILISMTDITNIKIIDFGISCYKDKCDNDRRKGALQFLDPKVYRYLKNNKSTVNSLSIYQQGDLWSLGIIIYKLIINHYPIEIYENKNEYYNNYVFSNERNHDLLVKTANRINALYNINLNLDIDLDEE